MAKDNIMIKKEIYSMVNLNNKEGNLFDGEFKQGKKDGNGVLIKKSGEKLEGKFKNDIFIGK